MFYAMWGVSRDLVIPSEDTHGAGVPASKWSQSQVQLHPCTQGSTPDPRFWSSWESLKENDRQKWLLRAPVGFYSQTHQGRGSG